MKKLLLNLARKFGYIHYRELTTREIIELDTDGYNCGYEEGFDDAMLVVKTSDDLLTDNQMTSIISRLEKLKNSACNG